MHMDSGMLLINLITLLIGAVTFEGSFKLINPWHSLYEQYSNAFQHLAAFWGIPGRGIFLRILVGYGKFLCGAGASILCWVDYPPWSAILLAASISGIIAIMTGAVMSNFGKGWDATRESALLLSIAVVSLYLQAFYGSLRDSLVTVILCVLIGASVVAYFSYLRKQTLQSEKQSENGITVTLLAEGERAKTDSYYRLA